MAAILQSLVPPPQMEQSREWLLDNTMDKYCLQKKLAEHVIQDLHLVHTQHICYRQNEAMQKQRNPNAPKRPLSTLN